MNKEYLKNFLVDYIDNKINLDQAILITGRWGTGKTFFIKGFIDEIEENRKDLKIIYISLFGISSIKDIREKIYESFNPIFANKKVKIIKEVLKGVVSTKLKIDLDQQLNKFFNDEISKYIQLDVDEKKFINNISSFLFSNKQNKQPQYKNIIYIFDDLERIVFNKNIIEIFGFFNELIEQANAKVILISDEEWLKKFEDYNFFKEKIIAKTFNLTVSSINEIIKEFAKEYNEECRNFIIQKSMIIDEVYRYSNSNNLRALKQILSEWCYIFNKINKEIKDNEYFNDFFKTFLSLFFESKIKNGLFLNDEQLKKLNNILVSFKNKEESLEKEILKKYNLSRLFLNGIHWLRIINNEEQNINDILLKTIEFKPKPHPPCWYVIGNYMEFSEEKFEKCLKEVINDFKKCAFSQEWEFLNVVNVLLFFSDENIIDLSKQEIEKIALKCIDNFSKNDDWGKNKFQEITPFSTNFRFFSENKSPFREIRDRLRIIKNQKNLEYLSKKQEEEFNIMLNAIKQENLDLLIEILLNKYRAKNFFIKIEKIKELVDILKTCSIKGLDYFIQSLIERFNDNYKIHNIENWKFLKEEGPFFKEFKGLIEKELNNFDKKNNRYLLFKNLTEALETILGKIIEN